MNEILESFIDINLSNAKDEVPKSKGIYLWLNHQNEIVYVGIALGKNGLRHRICNQHLNPDYLEFREAKQNSKDIFQLGHALVKIKKNSQAKINSEDVIKIFNDDRKYTLISKDFNISIISALLV
mgnify:CR=1 FL=1